MFSFLPPLEFVQTRPNSGKNYRLGVKENRLAAAPGIAARLCQSSLQHGPHRFERVVARVFRLALDYLEQRMKGHVRGARDFADFRLRLAPQSIAHQLNCIHRETLNTEIGVSTSPNTVPFVGYAQTVQSLRRTARIDAREALANNLQRLLDDAAGRGLPHGNMKALGKRARVGHTTIARILDGDGYPRLDVIERIARAFSLDAYQMLVPGWELANPPVVPHTPAERALYRGIRAGMQAIEQQLDTPDEPEAEQRRNGADPRERAREPLPAAGPGRRTAPKRRKTKAA